MERKDMHYLLTDLLLEQSKITRYEVIGADDSTYFIEAVQERDRLMDKILSLFDKNNSRSKED